MGYIILFLHFVTLTVIAGLQRVRRMGSELLLGAQRIRGFTVWDTIYYHSGHTWVLPEGPEGGGEIRVGLDDFAVNLLGDIDSIALPGVGGEVRRGEEAVKVRCGKRSAWAVSPMDGIVTEVNRKARRDPTVITRDPYGRGWMFTMKPYNGGLRTLKELIRGENAREWLLHESEKLHQILSSELGVSMTDGGGMARNLSARLSSDQWHEVVKTFFKAEKQ